jgi:hypothetical protein
VEKPPGVGLAPARVERDQRILVRRGDFVLRARGLEQQRAHAELLEVEPSRELPDGLAFLRRRELARDGRECVLGRHAIAVPRAQRRRRARQRGADLGIADRGVERDRERDDEARDDEDEQRRDQRSREAVTPRRHVIALLRKPGVELLLEVLAVATQNSVLMKRPSETCEEQHARILHRQRGVRRRFLVGRRYGVDVGKCEERLGVGHPLDHLHAFLRVGRPFTTAQ